MDKHYDIGVIGWWHNSNYGSMLTYYALYLTLKKMNRSVLMIHEALGYETGRVKWDTNNVPHRFAKKYYDFTEQVDYRELPQYNAVCDTFVVGSDQLWNPHIGRVNSDCFLDFTSDDKKRISYGTSFGNAGVLETRPNFVKKNYGNIRRFDAVSVREDYAVKTARDNFNIQAVRVADPVFLPDVSDYIALADSADVKIGGEYLLAFILDPTEAKKNIVAEMAEEMGYKRIFVLTDPFQTAISKAEAVFSASNMEMFTLDQISPENFLCAYKNASYVITDSFHGTCFSYIFRKNFNVFYNMLRGADRFASIVGLMGLESRRIFEDGHTKPDMSPIDFSNAEKNIEELRVFSLNWLKNVLDTPKQFMKTICIPENISSVVEAKKCTGCSACGLLCPVGAITLRENAEGFINPVIDESKCTHCGICMNKCVSQNPTYKNSDEPKCYAVNADDDIRRKSSSGGMFTLVANYILDNGGNICGAAYKEDYSVEHIVINDRGQLDRLRGSKYMQSHTEASLRTVKTLLEQGSTVLFTGMPCQVAGLYAYLGKEYEHLYTIDLVCHGITSSKVFEKYRKDVFGMKELQRIEFKDKEPWGWHAGVNAWFSDGTKYSVPCQTDPYFMAYLNSISKNTACASCTVNKMPRQGDLTIGDFWGIDKHDPSVNDGKGTSVVLLNNEKGKKLFDSITDKSKECREEPLSVAIRGNHSLVQPYGIHKNRNLFFENFDKFNFSALALGCCNDNLFINDEEAVKKVPPEDVELYYLAKAAAENCGGRKIVTWIRSQKFERILKEHFGLTVAFGVSMRKEALVANSVLDFNELQGKAGEYYLVIIDRAYDAVSYNELTRFGYTETQDYIYRLPKPTVLVNYDLSKGKYNDIHGNIVEGNGVIGKIVFRGGNNHISIGKNVRGLEKLDIDLLTNCSISIGDECLFLQELRIWTLLIQNGFSEIRIGNRCRFSNGLIRLYNNPHVSSVVIGERSTFESNIQLHVNAGKKIIIGRDCMFSYDIDMWAGDGHSIFNVKTGENVNSVYEKLPEHKNRIVIGDHVWVAKDAFILHGTEIGNGSIIGAKSVVKGRFPNNCSVAGNPARLISKDVAWSRANRSQNISDCGGYASLTEHWEE